MTSRKHTEKLKRENGKLEEPIKLNKNPYGASDTIALADESSLSVCVRPSALDTMWNSWLDFKFVQ